MPYVDLNTIHNPATGTVAPASWGDQVRDNDEWLIDPPSCSVKGSGDNIPNNTLTALTCDTELYDNSAMHSTVTNNTRITINTTGRYLFTATIQFASSGAQQGYRQGDFQVNAGTHFFGMIVPCVTDAGIQTTICFQRLMVLTAGDYVELIARQTAGGALVSSPIEFGALFLTR
jgi:hypothetical protein